MADKTERAVYKNRATWLLARNEYIGASEIASIMGVGYETPLDVWKRKSGLTQINDTDTPDERIRFGNDAEDGMRALFKVMHPEYELSFTPFTILRQKGKYHYLSDTPDGELTEKTTGRRGLYESKTAWLMTKADVEKWNMRVPDNYFLQICQGMYCGNFEFAVIFALLMDNERDAQIRAYKFERADCEKQIEQIQKEGARFMTFVRKGQMPATTIDL